MSDLNDMVIFSKVAETQGISPAARELKMPKSKVSRRMAALEDELGVRLLERSTRSVHLTEVGEIYAQHCKRIVEEAHSAQESVARALEAPRGHLRISASVTIGQHLLAPYVAEFIQLYPEIELELDLNNRRVDVIAEGFDLVVRVGALDDSTLVSRRLTTGYAKLFASPEYLQRAGIPRRLNGLEKHDFLCTTLATVTNQLTLVGPKEQQHTIPIKPITTTNDLTVLRQITIDGGGVALLPEYMGKPLVKTNRLHSVLPSWRSLPFHFYALYPSHRGITLKTRAWLDFLVTRLENSCCSLSR